MGMEGNRECYHYRSTMKMKECGGVGEKMPERKE